MSEDEDEAFQTGLVLGGDDGLAVMMMEENEDNGRGRHRSSSFGSDSVSKSAGNVQIVAALILVGIMLWLIYLVIR